VLFGGGAGPDGFNDTWEYDGTTWRNISTPLSPPARWGHAMTYSSLAGSVILFGGYLPEYSSSWNDTWSYDGITWTRVTPAVSPDPIEQHILVGGFRGDHVLSLSMMGMWLFLPEEALGAFTLTPMPTVTPDITPSRTPHCAAGWSHLDWGRYAVVKPGDQPAQVRSFPTTDPDNLLTVLSPGTIVRVIEGPWCNDGLVFWKVENEIIPGGSGWTAEGDGRAYYMDLYKP